MRYVQGDSGQVNILSGDSIGHCEEIRVIADRISKNKSIVNSNKEKILSVILILIQCLNNKSVAVRNKCSKIPPSTSVHFAAGV